MKSGIILGYRPGKDDTTERQENECGFYRCGCSLSFNFDLLASRKVRSFALQPSKIENCIVIFIAYAGLEILVPIYKQKGLRG